MRFFRTNRKRIKLNLLSPQSTLREQLTLFCLGLGLFSLVFSPFLLSISMFGVIFLAFFDIKGSRLVVAPSLQKNFNAFLKTPSFWGYTLLFIPVFFSGLYSEDWSYWLERIRIKAPFLALPLAYLLLPSLSQKAYKGIAIFYVLFMSLTALGILVNYALNYDEINTLIGQGHNIPVPRNHIRFSIGIAMAILIAITLTFDRRPFGKWQKNLFRFTAFFLFAFLHVLAVRSGLLGLYAGLLVFLIYALTTSTFRKIGLISALFIIISIIGSIQLVPSLRQKIGYMKYDWQMYQTGKGSGYSDAGRMLSMQLGLDIGKEKPLLGIGAGDIKNEMTIRLQKHNILKELMPHNEFIYYFATTGIIGLIFLIIGLFIPIFSGKNYKHVLFLGIQVILLTSFLTEATIETQAGVGYFLLWSLLSLKYLQEHSE